MISSNSLVTRSKLLPKMCAWLHIFPSTKITYILTSHTSSEQFLNQDISQAIFSILSPLPQKDLTQNCCVQFPPSLTHVRDMCKPRSPYLHMWLEMKSVSNNTFLLFLSLHYFSLNLLLTLSSSVFRIFADKMKVHGLIA